MEIFMPYKEYYTYAGHKDRSDAPHISELVERRRRQTDRDAWQAASANLAPDAFSDDVVDSDDRPYTKRTPTEVYGNLWHYE